MNVTTVFLSSTAKDLHKYREAAYRAIEGLDNWHCVRMEDFGARDAMADDFCCEKVGECDVFVGIVGLCYGSSAQGSDKSYTEQEYEVAVATNRPRLMFVAPENFPLPGSLREPDELWHKQLRFRTRVDQERIRDTFTSPEELAGKVRQAIFNWAQKHQPIAWTDYRGEFVPLLPEPYFPQPYPLQVNFTGYEKERAALTTWLSRDPHPLLTVVGIGGIGKSALSWTWLQEDVLQGGILLDGVLWWSFHEHEASFDSFLSRAIVYVSGSRCDPTSWPTYDKVNALHDALYQQRILLVLDGFEHELQAYAGFGRARGRDDTGVSFVSPRQKADFRACTDPNAGRFLRGLASVYPKTKTLLTSRLLVRDLDELAGAVSMELRGMDPESAIAFLRGQSVEGEAAAIETACKLCGYHPQSLRLLSNLITQDKKEPGQIAVALQPSVFKKLRREVYHDILGALHPEVQKLLSRLAMLPSPTTYEGLAACNFFERGAEFEEALDELMGWGLLLRDASKAHCYGVHPSLQGYAYDRRLEPAIGELWFKSKAEIFWLTTCIARAFAQGHPAPFDKALEDILPRLKNVTLTPNTIRVIGNDAIFSVQALSRYSQPVTLWVRTRVDKALTEETPEKRLFEGLTSVQVSSDTVAKFSTDQAAIVNTTLGGQTSPTSDSE